MKAGDTHILDSSGRDMKVYISQSFDKPVIYLNTFEEEGDEVYRVLRESGCSDFTLVTVSGLSWNHDMSPWAIPKVREKDMPFTGGADAYLQILTERIMPAVEDLVPGQVPWRGLAGYSLAGLFALYAAYQTEVFTRFASVSGSLWFPGCKEYVFTQEMKVAPEAFYFSLGDKECRTRNPYMKTVQTCTEEIAAFYREKGIDTIYELNPGNHFQDSARRMASGIAWILDR